MHSRFIRPNRLIRFRVWDIEGKAFVETHDGLNFGGMPVVAYINDKEYIVVEFTDSFDKNGNPIYEGDIIAFDYKGTPAKGQIGWDDMYVGYSMSSKVFFGSGLLVRGKMDDYEVVGNIFENEDLLK